MKRAFTLAEVLITIGIIGIVAALTFPMLLSNWRKKTVEARLKKFYSISNQAIMLSEAENGSKTYWAVCGQAAKNYENVTFLSSCEEWYNTYLQNYLKTVKVEHFSNSNGYQNTAAYFEDGSVFVIKEGYDMFFYPFAKDFDKDNFYIIADDGSTSRPDSGTKFFAFSFRPNRPVTIANTEYLNKGIEPYKTLICSDEICNTLTRDELLNNSQYGCNESSPYKSYCTALIQDNNWTIPDDYPFTF